MEGSLVAYKVFTNGSVLNASEMNEYLMNQSVITFSNSTARSSAITSPVEGMITYLEDTQSYESWDGTEWIRIVSESTGNAIINGAFEINQRNFTTVTANELGGFTFDRWQRFSADGTNTFSAQTFTPGAAPLSGYEATNFIRTAVSGQTLSSAQTSLRTRLEDVRTFAGQTVTFSFFAKANSGTPKIALELDQQFGVGGSSAVQTFGGQVTISTSWTRYSLTVAVPSISGKTVGPSTYLGVTLFLSAGSDFNARTDSLGIQSNTFDIWGVQLEAGSVATPFKRNANSLQGELAACQRYYVRFGGDNVFEYFGNAIGESATLANALVQYPTNMRTTPSSIDFSTLRVSSQTGNDVALTNVTITTTSSSTKIARLVLTAASSITANRPYFFGTNNSTSGFLGFSAEL
jgi:hypothetical protein